MKREDEEENGVRERKQIRRGGNKVGNEAIQNKREKKEENERE